MRFQSLEHYGIDPQRLLLLALLLSLASGVGVYLATRDLLGPEAWIIGALCAVTTAYLVGSEPRRKLDIVSLWQAREAPIIAASAAVSVGATGSNSRALMLMMCEEGEVAAILESAKRRILLGRNPRETIIESAGEITSDSAAEALLSMVTREPGSIEDSGEELDTDFAATSLGEETKVPVFIAVCFFAPIMLLLFAVLTRSTSPLALAELLVLEFVVLNIAFAFSSRERRRLRL